MDEMVSETPPVAQEGGLLFFNSFNVAGCPRCGFSGVAPTVGQRMVRRPRYVRNPHTGAWEQQAGVSLGGVKSTFCPVCESDDAAINAELDHEERVTVRRREFAGTPRNAPCPCGSGVKYKKCHGR